MTKQSDAHEALAHDAYHAGNRYYPRKIGDTYAIGDSEIGEYIRRDLSGADAYRIAREMSGRAILSLIAERLGDVTEEMKRAGFKVNVWNNPATCDNPMCIGRVTMPADNDFRAMLAASPLVLGDGK